MSLWSNVLVSPTELVADREQREEVADVGAHGLRAHVCIRRERLDAAVDLVLQDGVPMHQRVHEPLALTVPLNGICRWRGRLHRLRQDLQDHEWVGARGVAEAEGIGIKMRRSV
jgi:hypothetical protein